MAKCIIPIAKLDTAQHWPSIGKDVAEDRLPISCRCWNNNSSMHLVANSGPNSGRQYLFSSQQRADAVPNSGFLTYRIVCRGKSDTWPSNVTSMGQTLTFLISELDAIVKVTIGLEQGEYWAIFRLKVGKFKQSAKAVVVVPALERCKLRHWPNNNSRLLAAKIGPILCRIISLGNSHLRRFVRRSTILEKKPDLLEKVVKKFHHNGKDGKFLPSMMGAFHFRTFSYFNYSRAQEVKFIKVDFTISNGNNSKLKKKNFISSFRSATVDLHCSLSIPFIYLSSGKHFNRQNLTKWVQPRGN